MTVSPEFRSRVLSLLDAAPAGSVLVVANTSPGGFVVAQTDDTDPRRLVILARALLSQASDELDTDNAGPGEIQLLCEVMSALSELPADDETESV